MEYEAVIGLEVHLHLKTRTKAFCGCSTEFGNTPNTQACPVCLGFPGSLPVLNRTALEYALKVALAFNCQIQEFTKFDRKHYYYPDLPKNYQISQYDLPLSRNGFLDIKLDGKIKRIGITRAHLEEDAGKLIHAENFTLVDFNRAGIPLLEIVSDPDINSPQEAYEYLTALKSTIEYLDVSDCDMEKGSLRCDANISIRPKGAKELGTKTELKNMNSFKAVRDALVFEIKRQTGLQDLGQAIVQETRLWDEKSQQTLAMRSKEEAKDYRYFPDPDLPQFIISKEKIAEIQNTIGELPQEKMQRFIKDYGLSQYHAKILVDNKEDAAYAEICLRGYPQKDKKVVTNWLVGPIAAIASDNAVSISGLGIEPKDTIELIGFVENGKISNLVGKSVLAQMAKTHKSPALIISEQNLVQISDEASLERDVNLVIQENPKVVQDYKTGKESSIMFLVGQVMKKTGGKANPKVVQEILKRRL